MILGVVMIKEITEKLKRINKLMNLGFNTPLMWALPFKPVDTDIDELIKWAERTANAILPENPHEKIFNIRTYRFFVDGTETFQQPHICDIKLSDLETEIKKYCDKYVCMIDAEVPDNGRFAGNIHIVRNSLGRPEFFTLEYCEKDIRAMVRDADKSITKKIDEVSTLQLELFCVVREAMNFKEEAILEWTWFKNLTGIKNENIVWWEYRSV